MQMSSSKNFGLCGCFLSDWGPEPHTPLLTNCICTCIQYTYSHRKGERGKSWTREKVRRATVHKAGSKLPTWLNESPVYWQQFTKLGRKYQHDWMNLQSIDSDMINTCRKVPLQVNIFRWTTFCFGVYIVNKSIIQTFSWSPPVSLLRIFSQSTPCPLYLYHPAHLSPPSPLSFLPFSSLSVFFTSELYTVSLSLYCTLYLCTLSPCPYTVSLLPFPILYLFSLSLYCLSSPFPYNVSLLSAPILSLRHCTVFLSLHNLSCPTVHWLCPYTVSLSL